MFHNENVKKLYRYFKPYQLLYAILNVVSGISIFLIFSTIGVLLQKLLDNISNPGMQSDYKQMTLYIVFVAVFAVISGASQIGFFWIEQKMQVSIRNDMIHSYFSASEQSVRDLSEDEVLNRINYDLPIYTRLFGYWMSGWCIVPIISGCISIVYLISIHWGTAVLCVACALLNLVLVQLFAKKREKLNRNITEEKSTITKFAQEMIRGNVETRVFHLADVFAKKNVSYIDTLEKNVFLDSRYLRIRQFVYSYFAECLSMILILLTGIFLAGKGWMQFSYIMLAVPLSDQIGQMIVAFGQIRNMYREYDPNGKRIFEVVDMEKDVEGHTDHEVCFENVSFGYGDKTVLHNISFAVNRGEKVAFVGESGSGKSTIMKLILHLYEPNCGKVKTYARNEIAYMPQDTGIFNTTIGRNVSLDESFDSEKIEEVMKRVNMHDAIVRKENGYQEVISSDNPGFSGGQIERIGIGRTLYQDRSVILMDEPTSALDHENVLQMKAMIDSGKDEKTWIVITHQLQFIQNFDRIFVMKNGEILDTGSHESLMKNCEFYQNMWKIQQSETS